MFKSLEDILVEYFGCKGSAFLRNPKKIDEGNYEYFTESGFKAYQKLLLLLDDLFTLGVFEDTDVDVEDVTQALDEIVRQE